MSVRWTLEIILDREAINMALLAELGKVRSGFENAGAVEAVCDGCWEGVGGGDGCGWECEGGEAGPGLEGVGGFELDVVPWPAGDLELVELGWEKS